MLPWLQRRMHLGIIEHILDYAKHTAVFSFAVYWVCVLSELINRNLHSCMIVADNQGGYKSKSGL